MIHLPEASLLVPPTIPVRTSYLVGEQADCLLEGAPTEWPGPTSENFTGYLAERRGWTRDGGPSTVFWYVSGEYYRGTLVIRHRLTPAVAEAGGHVGDHVVAPWRRQGITTRMLAAGLVECRRLGTGRMLLTPRPGQRTIAEGDPGERRRSGRPEAGRGPVLDQARRGRLSDRLTCRKDER